MYCEIVCKCIDSTGEIICNLTAQTLYQLVTSTQYGHIIIISFHIPTKIGIIGIW